MCSSTVSSNTNIDMLNLSRRAYHCLRRAGIDTVEQVVAMSDAELLAVQNLGPTLLTEIREKLSAYLASHPLVSHPLPEQLRPPESESPESTPERRKSPETPRLERPATSQVPISDETDLGALGLSTRSYNALLQADIMTIGQLARIPLGQFVTVRGLGQKSRKELEQKLRAYLADHPMALSELFASDKAELLFPLVDSVPLTPAAQALLDQIPLERLAVPARLHRQLHRWGIESVGELARQLEQASLISRQLGRYLAWLFEQDEAAWADEVAGRGISPLHRMALAGTTLETLVAEWLSALGGRREQVIRWRYGLSAERLTLKEVGQRLSLTRERVRQIQLDALSILEQPRHRERIAPLTALLFHLLADAGGLMNMQQLDAALRRELTVGDVNPINVVRLVLKLGDDFKWLRETKAVGLKSYPLARVDSIQKRFTRLLAQHNTPLPVEELLAHFKGTQLHKKHKDELDDAFLIACLRVHPGIEINEGMCALTRWSNKRLREMILALRELGEPSHYSVIAERTNARLPPDQQASDRNIYAHMHRRSDIFVRVGHGIFGLAEWGLPDDGSLANAAYRVLAEAGHPLHVEALIDRVLETWRARRSSVYAAIASDDRFCRTDRATFGLVEWESEEPDEK
jgi:hypothetical protein